MSKSRLSRTTICSTVVTVLCASLASAQIPLNPRRDSGSTINPAYEGWYPNEDGSFTMSFGYYSRNTEEVVEIPIGDDNFFSPGPSDRGQPDEFQPMRHWGVFTVVVPADFGEQRLTWTLANRGQKFAIPGHLHRDWLLDAKADPASGNTPPLLKLGAEGPQGSGPDGPILDGVTAKVGEPLELIVWATDDEIGRSTFRAQADPIMLHWFRHRGPEAVDFADAEPGVDKEAGGRASTTVTFAAPGKYVLRLRANDLSGVSSAGHSQCCWTNGYVEVEVAE